MAALTQARAPGRRRVVARAAIRLAVVAALGAIVGFAIGFLTPAHVEIAGSDTSIRMQLGQDYDEFGVDNVLTGKRLTTRAVFGEPLGVRAAIDLDVAMLTDSTGQFNANILPAYIQAYSDPEQLVHNIRWAIVKHLLVFALIGAALAVAAMLLWHSYRRWRVVYDRTHEQTALQRRAALAYRRPERTFARRLALAVVVLAVLGAVPSSAHTARPRTQLTGDAILAGTPLDGVQVEGLLRPALVAAQSYIETYFDQTNQFYDQLRTALVNYLAESAIKLPNAAPDGDPVAHLGFVTDRHCNTGMDRVIVALMQHFGVHTLISAGDDAFSGTFGFESACTHNLADKSKGADLTDVFVGGNHDSPLTMGDEAKQGIKTLTGPVVTVDGVHFLGLPDPRTSRYGQGIVPSDQTAQNELLQAQGDAAGKLACAASGPVIAVLHDPLAGDAAIEHGCGHVTVALDGHTHKQGGPTAVPQPAGGGTAYQFTGASSGGAPTESAVERTFASRLTVGPLNHDATVNIVTIDKRTGALLAVTEFRFTPELAITVTQQTP